MGSYVQIVPVKFKTYSVTTATSVKEDTQSFPYPLTLTAIPGASGTILVEYSTTPYSAAATSPTWIAWPSGAVSVTTSDTLMSPVSGLRFTATTATATVEISA